MIRTNLHTHTIFDDGKYTPEEMVESAVSLGFESIGFSVHSPLSFENDWSCLPEKLDEYIRTIRSLQDKYSSKIRIFNGIELDADHTEIDLSEFDYSIGAVHQLLIDGNVLDIDLSKDVLKEHVKRFFNGDYNAFSKEYYSKLSKFIIASRPDIIAHFDLVEKYNDGHALFDTDSAEYKLMVKLYLEKICFECPDIIIEVNTGAMFRMGNRNPYPAPFIMKYLKKRNMRITISSDSHSIDSLDYKFNEMEEYCKSFGFSEIWIFRDGKFVPEKI